MEEFGRRVFDRKSIMLFVILVGLLLVAANTPLIEVRMEDLWDNFREYALILGWRSYPEIARNPPMDWERQGLTKQLIESGEYKREEIGIMKEDTSSEQYRKDGHIRGGGSYDFLFPVGSLPKVISISGSVGITNLRVISENRVAYEVRNFAEEEIDMPFYTLNAIVLVKNSSNSEYEYQVETKCKRIAWVEVGEEKMSPGGVKEIVTGDISERLEKPLEEEGPGHSFVKIVALWMEYEQFE